MRSSLVRQRYGTTGVAICPKIGLHRKDGQSLLPPVTIGRPDIWIARITKIELAGYDIIEALPLKKLHRFEPGNDCRARRDPFPLSILLVRS